MSLFSSRDANTAMPLSATEMHFTLTFKGSS